MQWGDGMDRELLLKQLGRLAFVLDELMPQCAELVRDALALLKEQEEKRTPKLIIHGSMEEYWGVEEICPDCGKKWQSECVDTTYFCPGCGRSVKWE